MIESMKEGTIYAINWRQRMDKDFSAGNENETV